MQITRKEVETALSRLAGCEAGLRIEYWSPGDGKVRCRVVSTWTKNVYPFGAQWYSIRELYNCIQFSILMVNRLRNFGGTW
jgi:hypothetical protein